MDINERTKIPLFAVIGSIPIIVGGIFWLTVIYAQVSEAARINSRQDEEIYRQGQVLNQIGADIAEIKEHLRNIDRGLASLGR